MTKQEVHHCVLCDEPTGRCGEDSLLLPHGPVCAQCFEAAKSKEIMPSDEEIFTYQDFERHNTERF